jgi:hypothetical protein
MSKHNAAKKQTTTMSKAMEEAMAKRLASKNAPVIPAPSHPLAIAPVAPTQALAAPLTPPAEKPKAEAKPNPVKEVERTVTVEGVGDVSVTLYQVAFAEETKIFKTRKLAQMWLKDARKGKSSSKMDARKAAKWAKEIDRITKAISRMNAEVMLRGKGNVSDFLITAIDSLKEARKLATESEGANVEAPKEEAKQA